MSKFTFVVKKKSAAIRRRIDDSNASSWTSASENFCEERPKQYRGESLFGERPKRFRVENSNENRVKRYLGDEVSEERSKRFLGEDQSSFKMESSTATPERVSRRPQRLVLCEQESPNVAENCGEWEASPTFSGTGACILNSEDDPLSNSPVFDRPWNISQTSPGDEEDCTPSSPVISSFSSEASFSRIPLVLTPKKPSLDAVSRPKGPDSGKKTQRKFSKGGEAERVFRLRARWWSNAAIWQHAVREKGTSQPHLLFRIRSCEVLFSLITLSCVFISGDGTLCGSLSRGQPARLLLSQSVPNLEQSQFPPDAVMRVFPPWQTLSSQRAPLLWDISKFLVER